MTAGCMCLYALKIRGGELRGAGRCDCLLVTGTQWCRKDSDGARRAQSGWQTRLCGLRVSCPLDYALTKRVVMLYLPVDSAERGGAWWCVCRDRLEPCRCRGDVHDHPHRNASPPKTRACHGVGVGVHAGEALAAWPELRFGQAARLGRHRVRLSTRLLRAAPSFLPCQSLTDILYLPNHCVIAHCSRSQTG